LSLLARGQMESKRKHIRTFALASLNISFSHVESYEGYQHQEQVDDLFLMAA